MKGDEVKEAWGERGWGWGDGVKGDPDGVKGDGVGERGWSERALKDCSSVDELMQN